MPRGGIRIELKGLHKVRRKLADGKFRMHYYAWRGGPRVEGVPGTPEFIASYNAAVASCSALPSGSFSALLGRYRSSVDHTRLKATSRAEEARHLDIIGEKFGAAPLAAFDDKRMRLDVREWHQSMKETPRKADLVLGVLRKVLDFARNDGLLALNVAAGHAQLHKADRSTIIWTKDQIEAICAVSSAEFSRVILVAAYSGLARADLCALTWNAIDDHSIQFRRKKTNVLATVPLYDELRVVLKDIPRGDSVNVLLSPRGQPWKPHSLSQALKRAKHRAGIDADLRLHDLRGTCVTRLYALGLNDGEVADIVGWDERSVREIKKKYVAREAVATALIQRLNGTS